MFPEPKGQQTNDIEQTRGILAQTKSACTIVREEVCTMQRTCTAGLFLQLIEHLENLRFILPGSHLAIVPVDNLQSLVSDLLFFSPVCKVKKRDDLEVTKA